MSVQYSRMIWPLPRFGRTTIQLKETEVTCPAALTWMVLRYVPGAAVTAPEIRPLPASMLSPSGRPVAEYASVPPEALALMGSDTTLFWFTLCWPGFVTTGSVEFVTWMMRETDHTPFASTAKIIQ